MPEKARFSYNGKVGRWWLRHSLDSAHSRAYRKVAGFIRDSYVREPGTMVDYACGPGHLLALLSRHFAQSRLIGLDGSSFMLEQAHRNVERLPVECSRRISLVETKLPNFKMLRGEADLITYCFPNMVPLSTAKSPDSRSNWLSEKERGIARSLSLARGEESDAMGDPDPAANQFCLEQGRIISRNMRRMLAAGGFCIRIEYATMKRHELSPQELAHVAFEEGSLDEVVDGMRPPQWFRLVASAYFRSGVLEDVYEQTGDERDRNGGYLITVLKAV